MTPEQEAALRETVASIVKGEAKLIERMLTLRATKWLDFVLAELAATDESTPLARSVDGLSGEESDALIEMEYICSQLHGKSRERLICAAVRRLAGAKVQDGGE